MYHVQCIVIFTNPSNHILFWDTWRKRTSSGTSSPASCFSHTMSLRGDTTVPRAGELNDRAAWVKAKYGQEWAPSKVRTLELVNQSEIKCLESIHLLKLHISGGINVNINVNFIGIINIRQRQRAHVNINGSWGRRNRQTGRNTIDIIWRRSLVTVTDTGWCSFPSHWFQDQVSSFCDLVLSHVPELAFLGSWRTDQPYIVCKPVKRSKHTTSWTSGVCGFCSSDMVSKEWHTGNNSTANVWARFEPYS